MYTKILLILLFAFVTFTLALPSADVASDITEELDNLPLATAPYTADTTNNGEVEGLFISGNVTGMGEYDGWYKCETSGGSPSIGDIIGAATKFDSLGFQHCVQENPTASMCTKMVHFWSYVFSFFLFLLLFSPSFFSFTSVGRRKRNRSCEGKLVWLTV